MPGKKRVQVKNSQVEIKKIRYTRSNQNKQVLEIEEENNEEQIINQEFSKKKLEELSQDLNEKKIYAPTSSLERQPRNVKSQYATNKNTTMITSFAEQEIFRLKLLELEKQKKEEEDRIENAQSNIEKQRKSKKIHKQNHSSIDVPNFVIAPKLDIAPNPSLIDIQSYNSRPKRSRKNIKKNSFNLKQDGQETYSLNQDQEEEISNLPQSKKEANSIQKSETQTEFLPKYQVERKPIIFEFDNDYYQESQQSRNSKKIEKKGFQSQITDSDLEEEIIKIKPKKNNTQLKQYSQVIESLQESALPSELACRDPEKSEINNFLKIGLKQRGQSQVLYISGVPGIGKTACVLEIIRKLKEQKEQFIFVHINAMNLSAPENLYNQLLEDLSNTEGSSKSQACVILNEIFTKGRYPDFQNSKKNLNDICKQNKIILIDECDYLITPNQQLLYNLLQWPSHEQSHLSIVMIANTMDFPERLKPKLQSRIGNHRLVFKPYTSTQIDQIIQQRLQNINLFQKESIQFLAKKIATVSSDIRRTLQICRSSIEIAKKEYETKSNHRTIVKVTIDHIKEAYAKIYSQPYHNCLQQLNDRLKLLLLCIALDTTQRGYDLAFLSSITIRFNQISQNYFGQNTQLTQYQVLDLIRIFENLNLCETKIKKWIPSNGANKTSTENEGIFKNTSDHQLTLKITIDDLKNALKDDQIFTKLQSLF